MSRSLAPLPSLLALLAAATVASAQSLPSSPFRWGPVVWNPRLEYSLTHSAGVQSRPGNPTTTDSQIYSSPFELELGRHWKLNYTPTWTYYSNPDFKDTLEHRVLLAGKYLFGTWSAQVEEAYAVASAVLSETGGQATQETYSSSFGAAHRFSRHLVGQLTLLENVRSADGAGRSQSSSVFGALDYALTSRINAGLGLAFAYEANDLNPDAFIYRPDLQLRWQASKRTSLVIAAGWERRQFLGHKVLDLSTPIYSAALSYNPFDQTSLSFGLNRTLASSVFARRASEGLGWTATLKQRLLGRLQLTLNSAHQATDYVSTSLDGPSARNDRMQEYSAGLGVPFLKRGAVGVSYSHRRNSSDEAGFGFTSRTAGLTVSYSFEGRAAPREIE